MTRDEAIRRFNDAADGSFAAGAWIDRFVAIGILKLDDPKDLTDQFCCELRSLGYLGVFLEKDIAVALGRNGLKIVEK